MRRTRSSDVLAMYMTFPPFVVPLLVESSMSSGRRWSGEHHVRRSISGAPEIAITIQR